jgi:hypothetical protein
MQQLTKGLALLLEVEVQSFLMPGVVNVKHQTIYILEKQHIQPYNPNRNHLDTVFFIWCLKCRSHLVENILRLSFEEQLTNGAQEYNISLFR